MTRQILFKNCPLCNEGEIAQDDTKAIYHCDNCRLTLEERSILGLFKKDHYIVTDFGPENYALAQQGLTKTALRPDALKVAIGNVYPDEQIKAIAHGSLDLIRPVQTILAEIILEQLNETCFLHVMGLRRGQGQPLTDECGYRPTQPAPRQGMDWKDEGNLFCTTHRLVFPSNRFTFIRIDRKIVAVQTFTNGVAVQRKGETFATYFIDCYPHEAALVAAYIIAKVPALQKKMAAG